MSEPRHRAFVLIPSYNTGRLLAPTVEGALRAGFPVLVVIDGSTDNSAGSLDSMIEKNPSNLTVIKLEQNIGKGAAVLRGVQAMSERGFTHVLTMDSDGQHPADYITHFMNRSAKHPGSAILGRPIFSADAPNLRVQGRKISNFFADLETLFWGIEDSLFGMRLYPVADLLAILASTRWGRRFDFEPEMAVRLAWRGVPVMNVGTPVKYLSASEGGVSQFRYLRDNTLLTWMHARLMLGFLLRLPLLLFRGGNPHRLAPERVGAG